MNKYVLNGVVLAAGIVVGGFGGISANKANGSNDSELNQICVDYVKSDEHVAGKVTDIKIHLTEDRWGALVEFVQGDEEMVAYLEFEEL